MSKATKVLDRHPPSSSQLDLLERADASPELLLRMRAIAIQGPVEIDLLISAFAAVIERHAVLRSGFHHDPANGWSAIVEPSVEPAVGVEDWSAHGAESEEKWLRSLSSDEWFFDVSRPPMARLTIARLGTDLFGLAVTAHSLVADDWSLDIALRETAEIYAGRRSDEPSAVPMFTDPLARQDLEAATMFWSSHLDGAAPSRLPLRDAGLAARRSFCVSAMPIPSEDMRALSEAASRIGASMDALVAGAWALLLGRHEMQEQALFAAPHRRRPRFLSSDAPILGPLTVDLPCFVELDEHKHVGVWLRELHAMLIDACEHDSRSVSELRSFAGVLPDAEFLTSSVTADDGDDHSATPWRDLGFGYRSLCVPRRGAFPLSLRLAAGMQPMLHADYDAGQFDDAAIRLLLERFHHALCWLPRSLEKRLSDYSLASDGRAPVLCGAPPPRPTEGLWTTLEKRLAKTDASLLAPDGAVIADGPQLLVRAAAIDAALSAAGVSDGETIALLLEPSLAYVASILACLRRASCYAPIDPLLPAQAIATRLANSGIRALVASSARFSALRAPSGVIVIDPETAPSVAAREARPNSDPDAPMLMVWTSGSTGAPKAPLLSESAILNRLNWGSSAYPREAGACGLLKTSPAFVDAVAEVLQPLLDGYPVVVPDPEEARSPSALVVLLRLARATRLVATPSVLAAMIDADGDSSAWPVMRLHISGEPLHPRLVRDLSRKLQPDALALDMYGSTEVSADVTAARIDIAADAPDIVIGTPLPGCEIWLLDHNGAPTPRGAVGELHVAGAALALGYHGDNDLTARRFRVWRAPDGRSVRIFATGDLARRRFDGALVHLGRKDAQIKIGGVRIEPGEIEARISELPEVKTAVVLAVPGAAPEEKRLIAYVEPHAHEPTSEQRAEHWRALYDDAYQEIAREGRALDDFRIWVGAIDGKPIPADHMRAWVDATIALTREGAPRSVVEIGCGQGLLLGRMAAEHACYLGVDISHDALECVRRLQKTHPELAHVRLHQAPADRRLPEELVPAGGFDCVLLSSVVQYFPDADYLRRALAELEPSVAEGGRIVIADIRAHHLRQLLLVDTLLARMSDSADMTTVFGWLNERLEHEPELLLDPRFFSSLGRRLPRLAAVEARPKPNAHDNELTAYRYDVILHLDRPPGGTPLVWREWMGAEEVMSELSKAPQILAVRAIPHRRLARAAAAARGLEQIAPEAPVAEWRRMIDDELAGSSPAAIGSDPSTLEQLGSAMGYQTVVGLDLTDDPAEFRAAFVPRGAPRPTIAESADVHVARASYANIPYDAVSAGDLALRVKNHLRRSLPPSFIPHHVVTIRDWPVSPTGKILKRKLAAPSASAADRASAPPSGRTEIRIASLWRELLGVEHVGRDDDFFESGGNSILLTQLTRAISRDFSIRFPLRAAFGAPTLSGMARNVDMMSKDATIP